MIKPDILKAYGVPYNYRYKKRTSIRFSDIFHQRNEIDRITITKDEQAKWYGSFLDNPQHLITPYKICVSSEPEDSAMIFGKNIIEAAAVNNISAYMLNLPRIQNEVFKENLINQDLKVLVIFNTYIDSTPARLQLLRDTVKYFDDIMIIVITSHDNVVEFADKVLKFTANCYFSCHNLVR